MSDVLTGLAVGGTLAVLMFVGFVFGTAYESLQRDKKDCEEGRHSYSDKCQHCGKVQP